MSVEEERPLPESWDWVSLGSVAKPDRNRVNPQEFPELPFIGMDDVESETMRLLGTKPSQDMKSSSEHFFPGNVLYGSLRPYLNKVYRPEFEGLCSAEFIVFRDTPILENKYLQYFLNQWSFVSFINRQNTGDRPRVKFSQMADHPFPLAPLPEQQLIVAEIEKQFTRLDQAVASLKRAQANLQRYKASVLKAACEGKLVPQDPNDEPAEKLLERILTERRARWEEEAWVKLVHKAQKKVAQNGRKAQGLPARLSDLEPEEWQDIPEADYARYLPKNEKWKEKYKEPEGVDTAVMAELPDGWVWANLEQLAWDSSYGTSQKCSYEAAGYPVLRIPNIISGQVDLEDLKYAIDNSKLGDQFNAIAPGDILIIRTNGSRNLIGRAAVVKNQLENLHYYASYLIRFRLITKEDFSHWLGLIWDSQYVRNWIESAAATSAGQYNISQTKLNTLTVPIPPLQEQERIVREAERRLSVIAANEEAITADLARAERLRQSILQQAFSGRLVQQDPV